MLGALAARDAGALRQCLFSESTTQEAYVDATARMLVAGRQMADAATARFGPAADGIGKGPIVPSDLGSVDQATVTVKDDTAQVLLPGHTLPLRFVKRGDAWLFKVVDFAGSQPRDLEKQAKLADLFAAAMLEAATEIDQGRYGTVADTEAAIRQKLNMVLVRSLTTQPTTRPT